MTGLDQIEIAVRSLLAEERYYAAAGANPSIRAKLKAEADRLARELDAAVYEVLAGADPDTSGSPPDRPDSR